MAGFTAKGIKGEGIFLKAAEVNKAFATRDETIRQQQERIDALEEGLKELLDAETTHFPTYEDGREAQEAWADRRAKARNDADFLLAHPTTGSIEKMVWEESAKAVQEMEPRIQYEGCKPLLYVENVVEMLRKRAEGKDE